MWTNNRFMVQLDFRYLLRIDLLVALLVSLLAFVFMSISAMDLWMTITTSMMGCVIIFLIGLQNILVFGRGKKLRYQWPPERAGRWRRYLISFVLAPAIYLIIWMIFSPLNREDPLLWLRDRRFLFISMLSSVLINILQMLVFNYYYYQRSKLQAEIETFKLKSTISETSNQLLKQQIHPHFLFNVLTSIKSLYRQDINQGEAYLVHLANFLRASISDPGTKIVTVQEELRLCEDYIEMQRIRFGAALIYRIGPMEAVHNRLVPYFSIQILLENAIKHNDFTEEIPLCIEVSPVNQDILVSNNLQPRHFKETSTHSGLANLQERYRLLGSEGIEIRQTAHTFEVQIQTLEDEYRHYRG